MTKDSFVTTKTTAFTLGFILLLFTFGSAFLTYQSIRNHDLVRFRNASNQIIQAIEFRLETYVNTLQQTQSMLTAAGEVRLEKFSTYIESLDILQKYPGIQGIGYAKRITPQDRSILERKITTERGAKFTVWPVDQTGSQFPIIYLEPQDWRNLRAIGYDMFSDPTRHQAMQRAWDTGQPAMSGMVELVQETEQDKQKGFLIYVPYFIKGELQGFVYSPFRSRDLFRQIITSLDDLPIQLRVSFRDTENGLLFERFSNSEPSSDALATQADLEIAQKVWRIHVSALPGFIQSSALWYPLGIIFLGGILSWMIPAALIRNSRHALELSARTKDLEKVLEATQVLSSQLELHQVVQTITDVGKELSGAHFGAFFYSNLDDGGQSYLLYTLSGMSRDAFEKFPHPRATEVFAPTFLDAETVMSDDITKDPRYGKNAPNSGMPHGHPLVTSYLAVSVKSRTGEVLGGLFYGHPHSGVFGEREKRLIEGIAPHAAIAIDNARLFEKAQKAISTRDEFLSIASHELKTPITSMMIQFQHAARQIDQGSDKIYDRDSVEKRVKTALRQVSRMAKLIEDMLDTSRIALNKLELSKSEFNLVKLIRELQERYSEQLSGHFQLVSEHQELWIYADEFRLEQVLSNLLNNSIKYGESKPISIIVSKNAKEVVISVRDQGPGVPPEKLPFIFERYERAIDNSKISGLGLGLYISKNIIELHGGSISVTNLPDHGAEFTVKIPQIHDSSLGC